MGSTLEFEPGLDADKVEVVAIVTGVLFPVSVCVIVEFPGRVLFKMVNV